MDTFEPAAPAATLPLAGVRVLDFSKVLAGPVCTQYLSDLGADVVKVEPVEHGDDTRLWPPFEHGQGTIFLAVNRNKRSLALDLKAPDGMAVCRDLLRRADVVVESFGPGVAERLGIGYEAVRELRPDLVYCSISGYGSRGPMAHGKGYDLIAQAFTGMLSVTGEPDGPPVRSPFSPVDQGTGMNAAIGILGGLLNRSRTGRGLRVEASLFDSAVGFLGYFLQGFWQRGTEPQKPGSGHESLCPYKAFETADKPVILGVANDALWRSFTEVAGVPELAQDPRFAAGADRVRNRRACEDLVAGLLRQRTRAEWMARLEARGIPCSPVHNLGELSAHPHTEASGMLLRYTAPSGREVRGVAMPLRLDGDRPALRRPPPVLGQDTAAVLRELGYDDGRIGELAARGVVRCASASAAECGASRPPSQPPAEALR
jgi:crotonobetainyl-CoA:carnitine CoA-transferase CaiB-like acyl-CoA transferase